MRVRRPGDSIVHPFAFAPYGDDTRTAQIREMSGDLRLRLAEDLHEIADAELPLGHQIQQTQTGAIAEGPKEGDAVLHKVSIRNRAFRVMKAMNEPDGHYWVTDVRRRASQ